MLVYECMFVCVHLCGSVRETMKCEGTQVYSIFY